MSGAVDRDEDGVLAAEYALGLLTEAEARAFEARLATDPGLRAVYASWAEDLAGLADGIAEVQPPLAVRQAIDARLFPQDRQGWFGRLGLVSSLAGALVAALLVLWVSNQGLLRDEPVQGPVLQAQIAAPDQSLVVAASFRAADGVLEVAREAGAALPGRVLELWLIAGDSAPVSLGVLPDTPQARIVVPAALVTALDGAVLAISDEPPGGSPTGAPTGAVLATGEVTAL
jgi:anti-sigma-K factor RskA